VFKVFALQANRIGSHRVGAHWLRRRCKHTAHRRFSSRIEPGSKLNKALRTHQQIERRGMRDHLYGRVDDQDGVGGAQLARQRRRADLVAATGAPHLALEIFLIFYVTCIAMTWWFYLRKSFMAKQAPSLAETRV
jgi:hypothetical protein